MRLFLCSFAISTLASLHWEAGLVLVPKILVQFSNAFFLEAALENELHRREERGAADPSLLQLLSSLGSHSTVQAFLNWLPKTPGVQELGHSTREMVFPEWAGGSGSCTWTLCACSAFGC